MAYEGTAVVVTPPLPPGVVPFPRSNWTLFTELPTFDLRNGDLSDVTSVVIKAPIATPYHWTPIQGLAPVDAVKAMDEYIISHMAQMTRNPPSGLSPAQVRKAAICLGVARAVTTTFYRISDGDLIPGERATPVLIAGKDETGNVKYTPIPGLNPELINMLNAPLELTDTEKSVVCTLVKCAYGIIPMQGYSLMMSGHHYLSQADTQSRKVYAVVEKAYWKATEVKDWFSSDAGLIQDILWHKACHPVSVSFKINAAMDASIAAKLEAAGAGACASRLPAVEPELRSANSYVKLLATVNPLFQMFGGGVDFTRLNELIEIVKFYPPGVVNPAQMENMPEALVGTVNNRATAIQALSTMLKRNQDKVALCYGFYCALSDSSTTMGTAGAQDTLKTSFSLAKLKTQNFPSYMTGNQLFGDYQAARNAMRARGD
ncbi:hypothetical protein CFOL_v3_13600 [Cephalotus follicularis]|uniref:Uncharacterized protein n=1 Tax=Cephalotus follicularis TaxID=3775 RepID=A0A1Q3BQH4_CEPFO|nr:hypothetical protein CFOL_v3_13600 [Cephalotus follicularis]